MNLRTKRTKIQKVQYQEPSYNNTHSFFLYDNRLVTTINHIVMATERMYNGVYCDDFVVKSTLLTGHFITDNQITNLYEKYYIIANFANNIIRVENVIITDSSCTIEMGSMNDTYSFSLPTDSSYITKMTQTIRYEFIAEKYILEK